MSLVSLGLRLVGRNAWASLEGTTREPRGAQARLLTGILSQNRDTAYGRLHDFAHLRSVEAFRDAVPIGDYETFRPYVERIMGGEPQALTAEAPHMMTMTSGTTGQPKYIPVTASSAHASAQLTRAWLYRALLDHSEFLDGKLLAIVSPSVEGRAEGGIPYGSASGHICRDNAWIVRRVYAIPYPVFTIKDFDAKYYARARFALEADVSFIGTPNPSTLVRLTEAANSHSTEIIQDIRQGTLSDRFDITAAVRGLLAKGLRPNRSRALDLDRLMAVQGELRLQDAWPNLRLIGCWTGGSVGVQLERMRPLYGMGVPTRDLGYLASEAHMSLPITDHTSAGILALTANFFEFIPEAEFGSPGCRILLSDELTVGKTYYVILTTQTGLYRYDINDIVRVVGYYSQAPLIEFVRKGRDMTSIGGEKLHAAQVSEAFQGALRRVELACAHYRAVANAQENRYELLVECEGPAPERALLQHLLGAIDRILGDLNLEYRAKRESRRLSPPCLHVMRAGWHERRVQRDMISGRRDSQYKGTLLSASFEDGEQQDILDTISSPIW